ncbi:hypothetical protein L1987_37580 [Smallanthus sonchifolius]|uniref:Uncharacterized protein n=1 Tax=Smallanthus sonchifolius TaxID=185202 RepID=A0ACB9HGJ6_9ASTR|nr:hypothetical protein L1987_37580 [Smallanthus sonchifolius]
MMNTNMENNGGSSHKFQENEPNSEYFDDGDDDDDDSSSSEGEEETTGKDPNLEMGAENVKIEHKSFNLEDDHVVFVDESGQQKSIHDDESMIPDINAENKTKSADDKEQVLEIFDEIDETAHWLQLRDLENPRLKISS